MREQKKILVSVFIFLMTSSFDIPEKKVFGEYITNQAWLLELKPDYNFSCKTYGCGLIPEAPPTISTGTFELRRDTIILHYKDGKIDSLGFPLKNLWRRNRLHHINESTGKISKRPYAFKNKEK